MTKKILEILKQKLLEERKAVEGELERIAVKKTGVPGKWEIKYPASDGDAGHQAEERQADELEEFDTRQSLAQSLERRLADIGLALEKIAKGTYGQCENCGKKIPVERLEIFPEARFCFNCDEE